MKARKSHPKSFLRTPVSLAIMSVLTGAHVAHAQQTPPVDPNVTQQTPAATPNVTAQTPAAAPNVATLPEIVITATKRATSLQKTPVAVTAINAAELEKAQVQTVADLAYLAPSFQGTTQGDHGVITMTLRGVGNDSAKTEYADPEIAVFVDGVYSPRAEGAAALLFDMESVEILRGPQGTLWGKNSTVGAVNMQTAKPALNEMFGNFEGGLGNYNRFSTRGAFNVPLGDMVAMRFAFAKEQHDGYVAYQNPTRYTVAQQQAAYLAGGGTLATFQPINYNLFVTGGQKYNAQNQTAARVSFLFKPSAGFSWNLSYEKFLDRGTPSMDLMQVPRAGQSLWSALIDTAPYLDRTADSVRSRVDLALSNDMALSYVAGWSHFTGSGTFDQDRGVQIPTSFATGATHQEDRTNWSKYTNHSHEVAVQSTGKKTVDWILGAYYSAEKNGIRFDIPIMNGTDQGTVGWQGSFIQPKETAKSAAVFGQATFNVSDTVHLTGGLRHTSDKRANIGGRGHGWAYDPLVPQRPVDPGLNPALPGSGFNDGCCNDGSYSSSKLTWLARGNFDLSKDSMLYASVSTGYKSGSVQDGGKTYGPETLTNYEIGIKQTFMDGKVRFNNSVYYSDFEGFQFSSPVLNADGTRSFLTKNAEGAKVSGFESELTAKLTADDRLQLTLAFSKTKLGKLLGLSNDYVLPPCKADPTFGGCLDVTGNKLPHAPSFSIQTMYEHAFRMSSGASLTPRISFHYETVSWLSVFNLGDPDKQKAYTRTDLGMRFQSGKSWWADAYVRNVEDADIKTSAAGGGPNGFVAQYKPPRTYGINVGTSF